MASCLLPIKMQIGVKKDKTLSFTKDELQDPVLRQADIDNKEVHFMLLPCGRCYNCRLNRAREWSLRVLHEYQTNYRDKSLFFITLTYDNQHLGINSLDYRDIQLFLKRFRKKFNYPDIKYLVVGEYGFKTGRKHWHLILLGMNYVNFNLIRKLWNNGNVDIDYVRKPSSAVYYMLKYAMKDWKITRKEYINDGRTPPMFRCSKGFGGEYARKNLNEIFKAGYISYNGFKYKIPRYYRRLYYSINLVDGWKEYAENKKQIDLNMLTDLHNNLSYCGLVEFNSDNIYDVGYYLQVMRPIMSKLNDKLFETYFKRLVEKY